MAPALSPRLLPVLALTTSPFGNKIHKCLNRAAYSKIIHVLTELYTIQQKLATESITPATDMLLCMLLPLSSGI